MDGLTEVRSRIAEIQGRFATVMPRSSTGPASWTAVAATAGLLQDRGSPVTAAANASQASPTSSMPSGGTATESAVIAKAREFLGVPYLWGGTDPRKGLDCSGFVQLVYKSQGIDLPRVSSQQATAGRAVASLDQARPGDLLFYDYSPSRPGIDHVGIYLGDGRMIAAPQPGDVVKIQSVGEPTVIRRVMQQ